MNKYDKIPPEKFEFVQRDSKIYDKKFETKPIGYFKDAMIRFSKNRTNVIATSILFVIILCTIIIPVVSTRNYEDLEEGISNLPPKVPFLENFGILDGTSKVKDQKIDLSTIDPETGLGVPSADFYTHDFIIMDTLENYDKVCTEKEAQCRFGEQKLSVGAKFDRIAVESTKNVIMLVPFNPTVTVDIKAITPDTVLNLYFRVPNPDFKPVEEYANQTCDGDEILHLGECYDPEPTCNANEAFVDGECVLAAATCQKVDVIDPTTLEVTKVQQTLNDGQCYTPVQEFFYNYITSTDEAGLFVVDIKALFDAGNPNISQNINTTIVLEVYSTSNSGFNDNDKPHAILNSVSVEQDESFGSAVRVQYLNDSGYNLSKYEIMGVTRNYEGEEVPAGGGFYARQNGVVILSSFRYKAYDAAFAAKNDPAFANSKLLTIVKDYPELCALPPVGTSLTGWEFQEGCPIISIISKTESVFVRQDDMPVDGVCPENLTFFDTDADVNNGDGECKLETFSYNVMYDYAIYKGYDDIPYFINGTTSAGRDLFTLIWVATRTSLLIGVVVAVINISIGVVYGAISGYYGGLTDLLMQRFGEVVGRVPWIVTLSLFMALFGPGVRTLIFILIFNGWIGVASITRTQFYRYKGREYVLASRTLGAKDSRLIFRHILPNGIGTIITSSILTIPYVIFSESTISFLGFGIGHGSNFKILGINFSGVSIGVLLADASTKLLNQPYLTVFPAILISVLMITFNMFGNALRDAFNPSLRGSE